VIVTGYRPQRYEVTKDMMIGKLPAIAIGAVALTVAGSLPLVLAPSAALAGRTVAHDSFERSLAKWKPTSRATRLDRVPNGRGAHSKAARLRPPRSRSASIGMTDAPGLVRASHRGVRYLASAWIKATPDAHRAHALKVRLSLGEVRSRGLGPHAWRMTRVGSSRWRHISVPFTARHSGRKLDVTIRAQHAPRGGALLVDDVRVRRVQTPHATNHRLRGVHFGASVDEGGRTWSRAIHLSDRRYTHMEVIRVFEPTIRDTWSGVLGGKRRPVNVSFTAYPSQVLSGDFDRALRQWFRDAPNRIPIWWTYWHEPEDDIASGKISALRYRKAWRHINAIARRAGTPNLHPTLVLMAWTAHAASGLSVRHYYPGDFIDVIGWDGYNPPGTRVYAPPRHTFGPAAAKSKRLGARFAIPELGSLVVPGDDGSRRASWLVNVAKYAGSKNAAFVAYWDAKIPNKNYQLRDLPSRRAWRGVVKD
jgi:hypothetical protein